MRLQGGDGERLAVHRLPAAPVCMDDRAPGQVMMAGKVPWDPACRSVHFVVDDRVMASVEVPPHGPEVELTWQPPERPGGPQELTWVATHPDDADVHFLVAYSNDDGERWRPVSFVTPDAGHVVDVDMLPAGPRCRFRVLATDGFHTVTATSEPFPVPARPCQAVILSPLEGAVVGPPGTAVLAGHGWWPDDDRAEHEALEWESSLDGPLGRGSALEVDLSPGTHQLVLTAGDGDRAGTAAVVVEVKPEPPPS